MKIKIGDDTKKELMRLAETKRISLEGNILKVIDADGDEEFGAYLKESIEKDTSNRKKRLEITKQIQKQNRELLEGQEEIERINTQLKKALEEAEESRKEAICAKDQAEKAMMDEQLAKEEAERAKSVAINAKEVAENDLDFLQKKTQFELIGTIVKVALWVILGVGLITTAVFVIALFSGKDTSIIGSTWSNITGILLTNAFSIIGTIMGVKYASEKKH
jgi:hypothetical protein